MVGAAIILGAAFGLVIVSVPARMGVVRALVLGIALAGSLDILFEAPAPLVKLSVCLLASWLLRAHFGQVVAAASGVFIVSVLLFSQPPSSPNPGVSEPSRLPALPAIVHLLFDEHAGTHGLPREIPEAAALGDDLIRFYVTRGFQLHTHAYSEYFDTHDSIPNALNLTSNAVRFSYIDRDIAPLTLERSRYFESLSERGYQINVYQSDFLDYCSIPSVRYGVCDTYRILSIGDLSDTSLSTAEKAKFILNSLVDASYRLTWLRRVYGMARERGLPLPRWTVVSTRIGPLPVLPLLQRLTSALRKAEGGNVYFAHLMMPHFPYALDAQCQVRPQVARWRHRTLRQTGPVRNTSSSRRDRYRDYAAQVRCQQRWLHELLAALDSSPVGNDALVIVHGDHGARIMLRAPELFAASTLTETDFRDAYSTLFAIRSGRASEGALVQVPASLQMLLAPIIDAKLPTSARGVYVKSGASKVLHWRPLRGF